MYFYWPVFYQIWRKLESDLNNRMIWKQHEWNNNTDKSKSPEEISRLNPPVVFCPLHSFPHVSALDVLLFLSWTVHQLSSCQLMTSHPFTQRGRQETTSCELWWCLTLLSVRHVVMDSSIVPQTRRTARGHGPDCKFISLHVLHSHFLF